MRVTLVHNPEAGDSDHDRPWLVRLLETAGHEVRYVSSADPSWETAVKAPADLIAVAGGDGTVGKVARRLGAADPPIAVLAAGTANNMATGLGLAGISAEALVSGWAQARRQPFDIGIVRGQQWTSTFVESVGVGLLADAFATIDGDEGLSTQLERAQDPVATAIDVYRDLLHDLQPVAVGLQVDGRDLSGEYLLVEILNFGIAGPNLRLAPDARFADGLLDVVLVDDSHRDELREQLPLYRTDPSSAPRLATHRGRSITLDFGGRGMHLDDKVRSAAADTMGPSVHVSLARDGVTFLI